IFSQQPVAVPSELGLEAVGRVIEAGMDHAAVSAAGVQTALSLFLDEGHAAVREPRFQFARDAEADDSAPDYQKIRGHHHHANVACSLRSGSASRLVNRPVGDNQDQAASNSPMLLMFAL